MREVGASQNRSVVQKDSWKAQQVFLMIFFCGAPSSFSDSLSALMSWNVAPVFFVDGEAIASVFSSPFPTHLCKYGQLLTCTVIRGEMDGMLVDIRSDVERGYRSCFQLGCRSLYPLAPTQMHKKKKRKSDINDFWLNDLLLVSSVLFLLWQFLSYIYILMLRDIVPPLPIYLPALMQCIRQNGFSFIWQLGLI